MQPLRITVNDQQLIASADINLHVRDRRTAERRAIEVVNQLLHELNLFAQPNAGFALNPDRPQELLSLSEPERNASPHLIDANRLRDIYNVMRSPLKQDLDVRIASPPTESEGRTRFTLGVIRGGCDGLEEQVRERADNNERPIVTRSFIVPSTRAEQFDHFLLAVRKSFSETVDEAYDPRSRRNYDREHRQIVKWPREFHPAFAPHVLDDAIRTHLPSFPEITAERIARGRQNRDGGAGRA